MLDGVFDVIFSLFLRGSYLNPDCLVYIACFIVNEDETMTASHLPQSVYDGLDVKPIIEEKSVIHVYDFCLQHCDKRVRESSYEDKGQWASIVPDPGVFESFPKSEWDDLFLFIFPPRTKSDIGIRNIRLFDIYELYKSDYIEELFWDIVQRLPGKSYIFVCNILLYQYLVSPEWWTMLRESGASLLSEYKLRDCLKDMSDLCKKKDFIEKRRQVSVYIETHNLFGALQPPVEGWDPVTQTKELASCDIPIHGLLGTDLVGDNFFSSSMNSCLRAEPLKLRDFEKMYPDLKDFLLYADWERSGTSSLGRVEWTYTDPKDSKYSKIGSFKARKNFVLDLMTTEDLAQYCLGESAHIHNVAIIKSELAKIRIAVSSPLALYLLESWLLHWAHSFYLNWEGSTLEESTDEEFERNYDQWLRMRNNQYVLPYDFANFDHQITTNEVVMMTALGHDIAWSKYRGNDGPDFRLASDIILKSIKEAVLHDPPGHGKESYRVQNGLLSGMRGTSIMGNGFNLTCYTMAMTVMRKIMNRSDMLHKEIRGDDLRVTCPNQYVLILLYYIYKSLGMKANPSKFGLCIGRGDFLRLDCVGDQGMVGLPARTTPSITQRKPWKSAQWVGEGRLINVCENAYNVLRRTPNPDDPAVIKRFQHLVSTVTGLWSNRTRVHPSYVSVPRIAGGLGLGTWNQTDFISTKGNKIPVNMVESLDLDFQYPNLVDYERKKTYEEKFTQMCLHPDEKEVDTLIRQDRAQKLASDDVPDLINIIRYHYRQFVRGVKIRKVKVNKILIDNLLVHFSDYATFLEKLRPTQKVLRFIRDVSRDFIRVPFREYGNRSEEIRLRLRLGRMRGENVRDSLSMFPDFISTCRLLEKNLCVKRHVAIEWLTDGITINYSYEVHSSMIGPLSALTARILSDMWGKIPNPDYFTVLWDRVSRLVIDSFRKSKLYSYFFAV